MKSLSVNIPFFPELATALASVDVAQLCKDNNMEQYEADITFDPSIKMDLMDLPNKLPRLLVEVGNEDFYINRGRLINF